MVNGRLDRAGSDAKEKAKVISEVIEDWLRKGGWEKWESDQMVEEPELEPGIEPEPDRQNDEDESYQLSRRASYQSRQSRRSSIQSPVLAAEAIQAYAADVWAAAV